MASIPNAFSPLSAPGGVQHGDISFGAMGIPVTHGPQGGASIPFSPLGSVGPSVNNVAYDKQANISIPHHYISVVRDSDVDGQKMAQSLGQNMLLFARSYEKTVNGALSISLASLDGNTAEFLELWQLNEWLTHSGHYDSADELLQEWRIAGVLRVEVAPNTDSNYGRRAASRIFNLTVGGRARTFNVWGSDITEGTSLWLIVKKVHMLPSDSKKRQRDDMKWQLVPYASRSHTRPPLEQRKYLDIDENGNEYRAYGECIYVGMASETPRGATAPLNYTLGSTKDMLTLYRRGVIPDIEFYIGV